MIQPGGRSRAEQEHGELSPQAQSAHYPQLEIGDNRDTIEIDGSQVHFNSPLSHQDGFDHTVNGVRIRISGHTVVIA